MLGGGIKIWWEGEQSITGKFFQVGGDEQSLVLRGGGNSPPIPPVGKTLYINIYVYIQENLCIYRVFPMCIYIYIYIYVYIYIVCDHKMTQAMQFAETVLYLRALILSIMESSFLTPRYFFCFFYLVCKLCNGIFQSLCLSVNCMS